jgi:uncharacterized protein (TIGR02453 family)
MLKSSTLKFLRELEKNNNRPWFNENKPKFQEAKQDFEMFIAEFLNRLAKVDPDVADLESKSCVFRIYRDVRFSKDKSPYKTNFGASMNKGGRKVSFPGYYIHVKPDECFIGGGLYHPEKKMLNAVRQEIDYNENEFLRIVENKKFKEVFGNIFGDRLKKAPKGYQPDNPMIEWLKMKDFVFMHEFDEEILLKEDGMDSLIGKMKLLKPFVQFIKQPFYDEI